MSVNYQVPGRIFVLRQPSTMSCWATVGTMMMAWRNGQSLSIEGAMLLAGERWQQRFESGRGLSAADHRPFARACGMQCEQLQCFDVDGWLRMLQRHGPLAVVTASPFHARIMIGIQGRGDPDHTAVTIVDPWRGSKYPVNFRLFSRDFEAVASSPRYQVWHF